MNGIIKDLFNFIIQKFNVISSSIKRLFMPDYILGKAKIALKKALNKVLGVKPRDKNDYYRMGRYLVSKRLVSMIIFVIGIAGAYYFLFINPLVGIGSKGDNVKVYSYNSIPLRFVNDTVKIKAKSGYVAYYGEVKDGKAEGKGVLYTKNGETKYSGDFADNEYHGTGTLYGINGMPIYQGSFSHNLFEGEGTLYRENGSVEYAGEFHEGNKSGEGELYDSSSNLIFTGNFVSGEIMYGDFLGKSTAEVAAMYSGKRTIYYDDNHFVADMEEIGAYYLGSQNADYLDDSVQIQSVYVAGGECVIGNTKITTLEEAENLIGEPAFEGYSYITFQEAVVLGEGLETVNDFEDVRKVTSYDESVELYLTMYEYEELQYTFYSKDRTGSFLMYSIEK